MLEKNNDSEVHIGKVEQPSGGAQYRLWAGACRADCGSEAGPVLIILVGLIIGALFGIDRIKIDDSLSQLFRSNSREYRQYESEIKRFPAAEFDVLVVVEGKGLLSRPNLEKVRDLVTDLQLVEGTRGIISLFSARQAPAPGKLPAALFPSELPQGADYDKFIETVKSNEIIRGKLLSEDGTLALIVMSLEPDVVASSKLTKTIGDMRKLMAEDLAGSGLNAELSGVPRDAARNPQRGQTRRADLQCPGYRGRLYHRDHFLPQDIVHGRRCVSLRLLRSSSRSGGSDGPISISICF